MKRLTNAEKAELHKKLEEAEKAKFKLYENKIAELEKENAELKAVERMALYSKMSDHLTKAKKILQEFVDWANWQGNSKCPSFKSIQDKAEQFLNEVEK